MKNNNYKKIYLAGTIYNSDSFGSKWKTELMKSFLHTINVSYIFYDPNPTTNIDINKDKYLVTRDKATIEECDILIAYIEKITFGTTMEILHAFNNNKLIIIIDPNNDFKEDLWLNFHSHYIVNDTVSVTNIMSRLFSDELKIKTIIV
jgi:nucleoside 2-deoxyribosyltransferase